MVTLNRLLRVQRHRLALVIVLLSLAAAIVASHSVISDGHMGETAVMCLAVLGVGAGALAVVAGSDLRIRRLLSPVLCAPVAPGPVRPPQPRARAGPPLLQVFRL